MSRIVETPSGPFAYIMSTKSGISITYTIDGRVVSADEYWAAVHRAEYGPSPLEAARKNQ